MSEGHDMQSGGWALQPVVDMSATEFRTWQGLLEERIGLVLNEQRRTFLQINLAARMRELGVTDYAAYHRQIIDGPRGAVEWSTLLDRLTVQETRFFRHRASFEALERYGVWVAPAVRSRIRWRSALPRCCVIRRSPTTSV